MSNQITHLASYLLKIIRGQYTGKHLSGYQMILFYSNFCRFYQIHSFSIFQFRIKSSYFIWVATFRKMEHFQILDLIKADQGGFPENRNVKSGHY